MLPLQVFPDYPLKWRFKPLLPYAYQCDINILAMMLYGPWKRAQQFLAKQQNSIHSTILPQPGYAEPAPDADGKAENEEGKLVDQLGNKRETSGDVSESSGEEIWNEENLLSGHPPYQTSSLADLDDTTAAPLPSPSPGILNELGFVIRSEEDGSEQMIIRNQREQDSRAINSVDGVLEKRSVAIKRGSEETKQLNAEEGSKVTISTN
jgi:hypothetical protein